MKDKKNKAPMTNKSIYRLMLLLVYIVAPVYLIKNIIGGAASGAITIGICLAVFAGAAVAMHFLKTKDSTKQTVVSLSLVLLVFLISLNSGAYYSDDYCLYLAVVALSGLYFNPTITRFQSMVIPVLLVVQYIIHPEKVESLSQFIMCVVIFCLAAFLLCLVVTRGRAFIYISENKAEDAEKLLKSMQEVGEELQKSMTNTAAKYVELQEVNNQLILNANGLRSGSDGIVQGTQEVVDVCDEARGVVQLTEQQIEALNAEVYSCENAIVESSKSLEDMSKQMSSVREAMDSTNKVFSILEEQMGEISGVILELNKIASSTTMLALNASIEAARAGKMGAGFAVVANKVQQLAVDSNGCSQRVAEVLSAMQEQVLETTEQLRESTEAIGGSLTSLDELQNDFDSLTSRFENLYLNIENQNETIHKVDCVFDELKAKIAVMNEYTEENQAVVESIYASMDKCTEDLNVVIEDSKHLAEVSENMLQTGETK